MKPIDRKAFFLIGLWLLTAVGFYFLYVRGLTKALLEGGPVPEWFTRVVNMLYPRFLIEKHRLSSEFFLAKSDQVVLRGLAVAVAFIGAYQFISISGKARKKLADWWWSPISRSQASFYVRCLYAGIIFYSWDWFYDVEAWHRLASFYRPVSFYRLFSLPSEGFLMVIWISMLLACGWLMLKPLSFWVGVYASFSFMFLQGFYYNFEKIDHGFATFGFAVMLLPFLLWKTGTATLICGWPLHLIRLLIVGTYFLSGMEKLTVAGFDWFSPNNLAMHLQLHAAPIGDWLSQYPILLVLFSSVVIGWQLSFPLLLFRPKWKYPILAIGVIFHLSTYFFMGIGSLISPWCWVYCFFLEKPTVFLEKIKTK